MRPLLSMVLGAIALAGCDEARATRGPESSSARLESAAPALGTPPRELVVASFNVLYENASQSDAGEDVVDTETVHAVAALAEADVILFQETNPPFERAIRKALAGTHTTCAFHAPVRYSPGGLGFCARTDFAVETEREIDSPVAWFPAQHVVLRRGDARIQLLNVHLRPAIGARDAWWQANAATIADRDTEMNLYVSRLEPGVPAFIVGDFNDPNHGGVVSTLEARGFASALGLARGRATPGKEEPPRPTWRWAGEPPLEVELDHVMVDPTRFEVLRGEVRHIGRSDHFPILAWLREKRP